MATKAKITLEEVLLPTTVKPSRYDISLVPKLVECTFTGQETVEVQVTAATTTITLHANELSIDPVSVSYTAAGGKPVSLTTISYNLAAQTVTMTFDAEIQPGKGILCLAFQGRLNDDLSGFYRSKYTIRGESRYMAVTQFEATDARKAFPCWDEPALKAVFAITITAPADRVVISNSLVIRADTAPDGKQRVWKFADTPIMSTYLVAFIVGEFDVVAARGNNSVITSVYTPVGKAHLGLFALQAGVASLEYLEQLFGVPYMGGAKVDHLAIPDFAAGAMENTGCITYREAALLIDEKDSSLAMKQRVAQVVAHELSHQWFGNYTTMQWWRGLWLNEGFAKHMEYVVTNKLFPQWHTFSHFTAMVQAAAFSLDSMASTHPIEVEVAHPDEINEIFDLISYNKGASVIRMMFDWLTHDIGFKGLHAYLTKHALQNAVTEDLWGSLAEVSGLPVADVMRNWTQKPGYPYIAVSTTDRSAGALHRHSLKIESRRFIAPWALRNDAWPTSADFPAGASQEAVAAVSAAWKPDLPAIPDPKVGDVLNTDWNVPVSLVAGHGTVRDVVKVGVLLLDGPCASRADTLNAMAESIGEHASSAHAHWFKLNADHASFYRTVYDSALLARLHEAVRTASDRSSAPILGVNDRLGLVGDVAAGVSIGLSSVADLLTLVWQLRYETDYNVWVAVLDAVSDVKSSAESVSEKLGASLSGFIAALLAPVVAWVGWEPKPDEDSNAPLLRAMVIRHACIVGDHSAVAESLARFDAYAAGKGVISADLKQVIYNTAASHGGEARWNQLLDLFRKAAGSEEQRRAMTALGRASDKKLLQKALAMTIGDEVRSQDAPVIIAAVASNPGNDGRDATWQFLTANWETALRKFGGGNFIWSSIIGAATGAFDTKDAADAITDFFTTRPAGSAERKVKQNLEAIRSRVWRAHVLRNDPMDIVAYLEGLVKSVA